MEIDEQLARRLVDRQFPQWAGLPIRRVAHDGWDNRTFRLGDAMTVRMPTGPWYVPQVEKEQHWLPRLAPLLPRSSGSTRPAGQAPASTTSSAAGR